MTLGKVHLSLTERAAKQEHFQTFLGELHQKIEEMRRKKSIPQVWLFLDNCSIHTANNTKIAADSYGFKVLFNQSYRPDLNGIEGLWAHMKRLYRKKVAGFKAKKIKWDQYDLVREVYQEVSDEDARKEAERGLRNIMKIPSSQVGNLQTQMN